MGNYFCDSSDWEIDMKKMPLLLVVILLISIASASEAATFTVTTSSDSDCADYDCDLQSALNASAGNEEGDTISMASGTYDASGTSFYWAPVSKNFPVLISGASDGSTIIDGGNEANSNFTMWISTTNLADDSNAHMRLNNIVFQNGNSFPFDGGGVFLYSTQANITVENCVFNGNAANQGGGLYLISSSGDIAVTNNTFTGNTAIGFGGGAHAESSSGDVTVTNNTFTENSANEGGGAYFESSSGIITVTNNTFTGNSANEGGGGMYNESSSSPMVTNCTFSGNSAFDGGGMYNDTYSSPTVTNCTFSGNSAVHGGGMYNYSFDPTSSPTVTNCTFSGNSATSYGGGMYNSYSSPTVTNCILWGDTPQEIENDHSSPVVAYSDIQGGYLGTGNINADPRFLDPDGPDNISGNQDDDFHLTPKSPCIDAGDNSTPALPTTDIDGDNRKIDDPKVANTGNGTPPIVDMGADEYVPKEEDFPWEMFLPAIIRKK
jgi:parallel beta-helix repeat protein/predicted outer membrane repeat protein